MTLPSLTVLIPTYNGRRHLERCLPSVLRHAPRGSQVLVVDDASRDGTVAWLHAAFPLVEVLALPENRGFARAVNAGLERSRGQVVELLNNDTEVCPGWADAALPHFADPTVGAVAPLVLSMDRPAIIDSAGQEYLACGWAYDRGYGQELHAEYAQPGEVFGASGSSGFYRRAALQKSGGLLPEYDAYFEDTDLAFRLRWAGYRCMYEPASRVLHKGSSTYGQQNDRTVRLLSRNEELAWWINLPSRQLVKGLLPHLGFLLVRAARKLFSGQLGPYVRGKLQALALARQIMRRRREAQALAPDGNMLLPFPAASSSALSRGLTWLRQRRCA
jgi:hypothetical protein